MIHWGVWSVLTFNRHIEVIEVKRNSSKNDHMHNLSILASLHGRESASYRSWRPRSVLLKECHRCLLGSQDWQDGGGHVPNADPNLSQDFHKDCVKTWRKIEDIKTSYPQISCTFIFPDLTYPNWKQDIAFPIILKGSVFCHSSLSNLPSSQAWFTPWGSSWGEGRWKHESSPRPQGLSILCRDTRGYCTNSRWLD